MVFYNIDYQGNGKHNEAYLKLSPKALVLFPHTFIIMFP